MKHVITHRKAYREIVADVYALMNKGEANLTERELEKLGVMAKAAEDYEDNVLGLKPAKEFRTIAK